MSNYYGINRSDEYLQHWGIPKGGQRKNHKYLMRVKSGSGWRYLYTPAEVAAYGKERVSGALSKAGRMAKSLGKRIGSQASYGVRRVTGLFKDPMGNSRRASDGSDATSAIQSRLKKNRTHTGIRRNNNAPVNENTRNSNQGIRNGSRGEHESAAGDYSGKSKGSDTSLGARIKRAVTKSNTKVYGGKGTLNSVGSSKDQARKTTGTGRSLSTGGTNASWRAGRRGGKNDSSKTSVRGEVRAAVGKAKTAVGKAKQALGVNNTVSGVRKAYDSRNGAGSGHRSLIRTKYNRSTGSKTTDIGYGGRTVPSVGGGSVGTRGVNKTQYETMGQLRRDQTRTTYWRGQTGEERAAGKTRSKKKSYRK